MRRKLLITAWRSFTGRAILRGGQILQPAAALGLVIWASSGVFALAEQPRPKPRPEAVMDRALEGQMEEAAPSLATDAAAIDEALRLATEPSAATTTASAPPRDPGRGAITNLPLPRYVSLKTNQGNARRGPGLSHRIDWVFTRAGMPLKLTAEHGHWRRIEDGDGFGGWVHYALLSGVRSVLVAQDLANFYTRPNPNAALAFQAEAGVVAKIITCKDEWCQLSIEGERGWAPYSALWGVDPGEIIE